MTSEDFRQLALELPEAEEGEHMDHPDFRVRGKIFATIWPRGGNGVVMLTREQQRHTVESHPAAFAPVSGGWGAKGATVVNLENAQEPVVRNALTMAWLNQAPKSLAALCLPTRNGSILAGDQPENRI